MTDKSTVENDEFFRHAEKVLASVREALIEHKRAGNPIAVWEDGRVKWIEPEDIEIPEPVE